MNARNDNNLAHRDLECGDLSPLSAGDLSPSQGAAATHDSEPLAPGSASPTSRQSDQSGDKSPHSKTPWPHAPVHKLTEHGVYFVTAGTLNKQPFFAGAERLTFLEARLLELANHYNWQIEAWAIFPNHYHFVARGNPDSDPLRKYLTHLHADTAREVNRRDAQAGRKVWHNFWDTRLTFEKSYLARLNYVHQNAVKHGVVAVANQYCWCSAAWFERVTTPAMVQTIYGFKTDKLEVPDDF